MGPMRSESLIAERLVYLLDAHLLFREMRSFLMDVFV